MNLFCKILMETSIRFLHSIYHLRNYGHQNLYRIKFYGIIPLLGPIAHRIRAHGKSLIAHNCSKREGVEKSWLGYQNKNYGTWVWIFCRNGMARVFNPNIKLQGMSVNMHIKISKWKVVIHSFMTKERKKERK